MKRTLFTFSLPIILLACQPNAEQSSNEKNACDKLDEIDREMLDVLDDIKRKYKDDEQFLSRLNMAQVYWIQYKDSHVRALFPKKKDFYKEEYGMTYNICKCNEWARLTAIRVEELKMWLDGPKNRQQDCPNSIK